MNSSKEGKLYRDMTPEEELLHALGDEINANLDVIGVDLKNFIKIVRDQIRQHKLINET